LRLFDAISERSGALPIEHAFYSKPNGLSWPDENGNLFGSGQVGVQQIPAQKK
jgi:hypothetical protein